MSLRWLRALASRTARTYTRLHLRGEGLPPPDSCLNSVIFLSLKELEWNEVLLSVRVFFFLALREGREGELLLLLRERDERLWGDTAEGGGREGGRVQKKDLVREERSGSSPHLQPFIMSDSGVETSLLKGFQRGGINQD